MFIETLVPGVSPVAVADLKAHLRIEYNDEDVLLQQYINAATEQAEKVTRSRLSVQQVRITLDSLCAPIYLEDVSPVASIDAIKYLDTDGIEQTLSPVTYRLARGMPAQIVKAIGQTWPETLGESSVTIDLTVGYTVVPPPIVQWVMLKAGDLYEMREASSDKQAMQHTFVDHLLEPYRVY